MISNELLDKHRMLSLEELKAEFGDSTEIEIWFHKEFLNQTNEIMVKILEQFIETMTDDKINMGNMIKFFKNIKTEYADVLAARKIAREELKKLKENVNNT